MRRHQVHVCEPSDRGGSAAVSRGCGKIHGGDGDGDEVRGGRDEEGRVVPMEWREWIEGCGGQSVVIDLGDLSESGAGHEGSMTVELSSNGVEYTRGGMAVWYHREARLTVVGPSTGPEAGGTEVRLVGDGMMRGGCTAGADLGQA